jgi:hypothetical protein
MGEEIIDAAVCLNSACRILFGYMRKDIDDMKANTVRKDDLKDIRDSLLFWRQFWWVSLVGPVVVVVIVHYWK